MNDILKLYAIRNGEQYYKAGYRWVDTLEKARIFNTIGPPRAIITTLNEWLPNITLIELTVTKMSVIDETERLVKAKLAKERKLLKYKRQRDLNEIKRLKENLADAEKSLRELEARRDGI